MRDNSTFNSFKGQVSKHYDRIFADLKDSKKKTDKYGFLSRETYNALKYELLHMPFEDVESLPPDLQPWVKEIREPMNRISSHHKDLSETAKTLSEELLAIKRYSPWMEQTIGELAVDYDKPNFLEFLENPPARHLLSHMKAELPQLENLETWADLKVKDISQELLDRLSLRAERVDFQG